MTGYFQTPLAQRAIATAAYPQEEYLHGKVAAGFGILGPGGSDPKKLPGDPKKFGEKLVEIVDGTEAGAGKEIFNGSHLEKMRYGL